MKGTIDLIRSMVPKAEVRFRSAAADIHQQHFKPAWAWK